MAGGRRGDRAGGLSLAALGSRRGRRVRGVRRGGSALDGDAACRRVFLLHEVGRGGVPSNGRCGRGATGVWGSRRRSWALSIGLGGLDALGVAHGDVTLCNVPLESSGRPFLADLGVARLAGEAPGSQAEYARARRDSSRAEVLASGVPTASADAYAVGALAWWCVTGAVPEPGSGRRPLAEAAPGLPVAWSEVTTQALLGDPALPEGR